MRRRAILAETVAKPAALAGRETRRPAAAEPPVRRRATSLGLWFDRRTQCRCASRSSTTARATCARRAKAFEPRRAKPASMRRSMLTADPEVVARRRPHRAARRRRLRRLPRAASTPCRHGRGARRGGRCQRGAAVPRHLRRHAADGRARPGEDRHARPRLDPRRRRQIDAGRSGAQRSRRWAGTRSSSARRTRCSPAFRPETSGLHAYFVHSYHLERRATASDVVATADYGGPVTAAVGRDNMAGTQFHPEKSQALGLALIANFLWTWAPMILFPAIDLKDGQCVRLKHGDMDQATVFNADPAAQAQGLRGRRASNGCMWSTSTAPSPAEPVNGAAVEAILKATNNAGAARRRHPHARADRALAGQGLAPRDPRHRRGARSRAGQRGLHGCFPGRSPSASTRAAARSRSRAGPRRPTSTPSSWRGGSKTPASRRSSTPTSTATAS